jgi:hypothetical protein
MRGSGKEACLTDWEGTNRRGHLGVSKARKLSMDLVRVACPRYRMGGMDRPSMWADTKHGSQPDTLTQRQSAITPGEQRTGMDMSRCPRCYMSKSGQQAMQVNTGDGGPHIRVSRIT